MAFHVLQHLPQARIPQQCPHRRLLFRRLAAVYAVCQCLQALAQNCLHIPGRYTVPAGIIPEQIPEHCQVPGLQRLQPVADACLIAGFIIVGGHIDQQQATLRRIRKEFLITLPESEAAGIAMNLINNRMTPHQEPSAPDTVGDEEMLEDITDIVENHFHILVDRTSFNYSRYATHLQYLFGRIHAGKAINSDNLQLYKSLREEFPDIARCVERIADHIREVWNCELTEEEKLYLILHVNRICIKEGM